MQGYIKQQGQRNGPIGAELCELQPATTDGTAGRTQQLRGGLPEHSVSPQITETSFTFLNSTTGKACTEYQLHQSDKHCHKQIIKRRNCKLVAVQRCQLVPVRFVYYTCGMNIKFNKDTYQEVLIWMIQIRINFIVLWRKFVLDTLCHSKHNHIDTSFKDINNKMRHTEKQKANYTVTSVECFLQNSINSYMQAVLHLHRNIAPIPSITNT